MLSELLKIFRKEIETIKNDFPILLFLIALISTFLRPVITETLQNAEFKGWLRFSTYQPYIELILYCTFILFALIQIVCAVVYMVNQLLGKLYPKGFFTIGHQLIGIRYDIQKVLSFVMLCLQILHNIGICTFGYFTLIKAYFSCAFNSLWNILALLGCGINYGILFSQVIARLFYFHRVGDPLPEMFSRDKE